LKHGAKRLQIDGSLFDLKKDSVKVIATTIAGNVSSAVLILTRNRGRGGVTD